MQKGLKKLFENMTFFAINAIGVTIPLGIIVAVNVWSGIVKGILAEEIFSLATFVLLGIFNVCTYISYKKHCKNIMKGLIGGSLTLILLNCVTNLQNVLVSSQYSTLVLVENLIMVFLSCALLINHYLINSDRNPSPINVNINQIIVVVIGIVNILFVFGAVFSMLQINVITIIFLIANILSVLMNCGTVVCVESKLDAYKTNRTKAGWTEETGYPDDYDRTQNYGK